METILLFGLLFTLLTLSVPIGIALGVATIITMYFMTDIPVVLIAQNAFAGLDKFPLLAIPFFMLAGNLMAQGGISKRLLNLADALVGHLIGGLGAVTTLACMLFAAISGSGPATVSAIGSFMIPAMKEKGYSGGYSAAINACAGSIGPVIPPSIPFVLYGVVTGTSVGALFMAGVVPGIIVTILLISANYLIAKIYGYTGKNNRSSFKDTIKVLYESFAALMVPVIILGGIYGGIFTPTEAAVVAIVYALFAGIFIYKELGVMEIYQAFKDTALINGATTYMVGLSMSFAFLITMKQIPAQISTSLLALVDSPFFVILLINVFLIFVGCFIDNISSMIILAPILLPIAKAIGLDPVQFGVIMVVNVAIGFVSPPYGPNLFIASAVSGESMEAIVKFLPLLILALLITLAGVTFMPSLSLWLPRLLGLM